MKALVLTAPQGPQSATVTERDTPVPAAGEVRVALKAAALNHRELWVSLGQYPGMQLPAILGADGAGVVDAVGEGVDADMVGREVVLYPAANWGDNPDYPSPEFGCLGMPYPGTLAEYICVPADAVVAKPAGLTFAEAAAIPLAGLTAWRCLTTKGNLKAGEKVLITGIGGGVAIQALIFAVAMGAEVYVTSGAQDKIDQAVALGAKGGVVYKQEKWGKSLAALAGSVDVVIDGAPAVSFAEYSRCLNMGARVVIYGPTGGAKFQVVAPELFFRHATIHGSAMGTLDDFRAMMAFVAERNIKPVIDSQFNLDQAVDALLYLQNDHGMGKIVVNI
ncbi:MAG: alcohol dehydrogenase [Gammaproteobacteria bacterium BRH_c0]|nr:MAG: alcohol dehydrogenase [Gammaproteobacteria bacterium BRH_c0]